GTGSLGLRVSMLGATTGLDFLAFGAACGSACGGERGAEATADWKALAEPAIALRALAAVRCSNATSRKPPSSLAALAAGTASLAVVRAHDHQAAPPTKPRHKSEANSQDP